MGTQGPDSKGQEGSSRRGIPDIALGEHWRLTFNQTIVLHRINGVAPEPVHLTLVPHMSGSGHLNVHLTFGHESNMSDPSKPKGRIELLTLSEKDAEPYAELFRRFQDDLVKRVRRFRPGWLKRNGWVVVLVDEQEVLEDLKVLAPYRKKKFRLSTETFGTFEKVTTKPRPVCDPRVLRGFVPDDPMTMPTLAKEKPGKGSSTLLLSFFPGKGWVGIPPGETYGAVARLATALGDLVLPRLDIDKIELVIEHLELESLDYMERPLRRLRKALSVATSWA